MLGFLMKIYGNIFLNGILDLFNYPRRRHSSFQCASLSGNIIWSDITCVTKLLRLILE